MKFLIEALEIRSIDAVVTQTGSTCYRYAKPTIEPMLPNHYPVVFG